MKVSTATKHAAQPMNAMQRAALLCAVLCLSAPLPSLAWSRVGHMVSAAIAYDDLAERDRAVISKMAALLGQHPDRGTFELAAEGTQGRERARRLLMECARWPDDARNTLYDHPTWHYASRPVIRPDTPHPPGATTTSGQAIEALELNLRVAANPGAPWPERAVALCWVMHVAADMHQPLHATALYSAIYPQGDAGGNEQFVVDAAKNETVTLHWYWDDLVRPKADAASVVARARALMTQHPRASLPELTALKARQFAAWSFGETYPLAAQAYPATLQEGGTKEKPVTLPSGYAANAELTAQRRVAIAGFRLAELLREIAREREGN